MSKTVIESLRYTFSKLRVLQNLEVHVGVSRLPFLVKIQVLRDEERPLSIWFFLLGNRVNFTVRKTW